MKFSTNKIINFSLLAAFVLPVMNVTAQNSNNNNSDDKSVVALQKEIDQYPDSLALHEQYLKASGFTKWGVKEYPAFVNKYKQWMKKFPKSAIVPYALGHAYAGKESPKAKPYLEKAVAINPNLDIAYFDLWIDAERWGQFDKGTAYLKKAADVKPDNPDYAFYYASSFSKKDDQSKYEQLSLDVAKRFPNSERGAQALYWLAVRNQDAQFKAKIFELLKKSYAPSKFSWSSSGMSSYFNLLLTQNPQKALSLADEMAASVIDDRSKNSWNSQKILAAQIIYAKALMAANRAKDAVQLLDGIKISSYSPIAKEVLMLKADALKIDGKAGQAYEILKKSYAQSPETEVGKMLFNFGKQVNKSKDEIKKEVAYIRDTAAKAATDFSLNQYFAKGKASLANFKGKVVLLTYWFPGCGPCRGEFPHFQNVVNRFDKNDLAYVGINIVAEQNDYVIPFMKSSGYTFIPLEDFEGRNKGNMGSH